MKKRPLLIATSNEGKYREIESFLGDLPFDIVSLRGVTPTIAAPEENEATLAGNAMLKAAYYAEKTQLLTLSEDSGLFIDALNGWPGVHSARIAPTVEERNTLVIEKMRNVPLGKRTATFRISLVAYDPITKNSFVVSAGEQSVGTIVEHRQETAHGFGYDPIFFVTSAGKTYADMTVTEKNAISHRGKALSQMKYILQRQYGGEHIMVPIAIIVKDGKILMSKRNDPFRPEFHGKWEFPGGRMEIGETLEQNVIREVQEEVGFGVELVQRMNFIGMNHHSAATWEYQVYLLPMVCRINGGDGVHRDAEVIETVWFEPQEILDKDLIGNNGALYKQLLPELLHIIQAKHL